jgi:hypothetical protein
MIGGKSKVDFGGLPGGRRQSGVGTKKQRFGSNGDLALTGTDFTLA